ncbi:MAG: GLUG motif-containing protein [Thermoplasmata archaeon]
MTVISILSFETSSGGENVLEYDPIEISTVEELQAMKDDLSADYVLVNDIDASATEGWNMLGDEFNQTFGYGPVVGTSPGEYTLYYRPIDEILVARDLDGGSEVSNDVNIVDANEGIIKLNVATTGQLYIEYRTTEVQYEGFEPVGYYDSSFTGSFDGKNYILSGLYINRPSTHYIGLFGNIGIGGEVRNIGLIDADVTGNWRVGGLVGRNKGTMENSYAISDVIGSDRYVGGFVGKNEGTVSNSYAIGSVIGGNNVGGLVGDNRGTVSNSYATGNVSGRGNLGGLVGINLEGTVSNSYATGNVSGTGSYAGGLVGRNVEGTVSNSYATGSVSGSNYLGGLVGFNDEGTVSNSYATGSVSGEDYVGGLVGDNRGMVSNSYATGNVSGIDWVGGLVGRNWDTVSNSHYNVNEVLINDGHHLTIGGLFDEQYQNWFDNGLSLEITDYSDTLVSNGEYYGISKVQGIRDLLGFAGREGYRFRLAASIDLSTAPGLYVPYLAAEFDGQNYTISNLHINMSFTSILGMFGYVSPSGNIRNVGMVDVDVSGNYEVGGLVGRNSDSVENSYATGNVSGIDWVGGLVGRNIEGTVENSYATGNVSGDSNVGGLVGSNYEGTVSNSYATGNVSGDSNVGGLVGWNGDTIENSYSTGTITRKSGSTSTNFGGFVGRNYGGKAGFVSPIFRGEIINCYSTGGVHYEDAEDPTDKGFAGSVDTGGDYEMSGNFWDIETSGQNETAGDATGVNTAEMQSRSSYIDAGWEFDEVWDIDENKNDGYPYLQWQEFEDEGEGGEVYLLLGVVVVIIIALILFRVVASGKSDKFDRDQRS